ncbi:hypothetical protein [Nocardiopsis halophila]|uniref:hypothetical protein n=1 Tax=Nocardiopsis halophila TaxID=141692 RepID=UPI0003491B08|nr:hypothetical protein [Nocardiopsis halophila]
MSYGPPPPQGPGGYGPPPPPGGGYGAPPPPPPMGPSEPPANKGAAIALAILGFLFCCNIPALVLGIVAASMAESNPKAAKICMMIGWILFALGLVLSVFAFIVELGTASTY